MASLAGNPPRPRKSKLTLPLPEVWMSAFVFALFLGGGGEVPGRQGGERPNRVRIGRGAGRGAEACFLAGLSVKEMKMVQRCSACAIEMAACRTHLTATKCRR